MIDVPSGGVGKNLARLAHMKQLRADFVTSISEDLEKKVEGLMQDIPNLRNIVLNENKHEIWAIEQILQTRNNRNDDFCIELVHDVLERNSLILDGRYFSDWVTQVSMTPN